MHSPVRLLATRRLGAVPETRDVHRSVGGDVVAHVDVEALIWPAAEMPLPETCTVGGAAMIRRSLEYGETLRSVM